MSRDQKFFDMYSLVIGILVLFTVGILVLAMKMSDLTQGEYTRAGTEYQQAVNERIRPVGQIYLPGEEQAAPTPIVEVAADPVLVATVMSGPQVYNAACIACHGTGAIGAPIVGDVGEWSERIAQGADVLNDHAVNGFAGSTGAMPAKGGRLDLSDQEVRDAVEYMVDESK